MPGDLEPTEQVSTAAQPDPWVVAEVVEVALPTAGAVEVLALLALAIMGLAERPMGAQAAVGLEEVRVY
jgi:hypothetical protein